MGSATDGAVHHVLVVGRISAHRVGCRLRHADLNPLKQASSVWNARWAVANKKEIETESKLNRQVLRTARLLTWTPKGRCGRPYPAAGYFPPACVVAGLGGAEG